ncbi:hypothetical protein [Kingella oralis]|uniref:hypothetical protein n=1 Tax=Kingella oralis TaxID=505 RepID=UPI002D7E45A2|nr:hypothetical protein [Kingella oralis]
MSYTAYSSLNRQPENAPIHIRAMLFHAYTRLFRLPLLNTHHPTHRLTHFQAAYPTQRQPENHTQRTPHENHLCWHTRFCRCRAQRHRRRGL